MNWLRWFFKLLGKYCVLADFSKNKGATIYVTPFDHVVETQLNCCKSSIKFTGYVILLPNRFCFTVLLRSFKRFGY